MSKTEGLYLPEGYLNIDFFDKYDANFIIIIGGRGTGKTYSGFKKCLTNDRRFIYARRTDKIIKTIANGALDPMAPVSRDLHMGGIVCKTVPETEGYIHGWYHVGEDGKPTGEPISLAIGLSTVGNIRSFDAAEYTDYINDEFIKEPQMARFSENEAYTYFNSVETINRNRELQGKKPVKCWLFSNSENLANDYFVEWKLVDRFIDMKRKGQEVWYDTKRKMVLCYLLYSPISERKKKDALYIATEGTSFYDMAVGNVFVDDTNGRIKSRNLKGYVPIVAIGEICIYKSSKEDSTLYVSFHKNGACRTFGTTPLEIKRFRTWGRQILVDYMQDSIEFETVGAEATFKHFIIPD